MPQPESFAKCICQHCGGHIEFPIDGAGQKINCPHCNWPTLLTLPHVAPVEIGGGPAARKRVYLTFGIAACLVLAAGGVFLYSSSKNAQQQAALASRHDVSSNAVPASPSKKQPPPDPWHGLKASKISLDKAADGNLVYAIGVLTNDTTRQRFGVKVEIEVQDEHRNKLGTATDYAEVIEPGKEWKFRALVTAKAATAAKLTKVKEQE